MNNTNRNHNKPRREEIQFMKQHSTTKKRNGAPKSERAAHPETNNAREKLTRAVKEKVAQRGNTSEQAEAERARYRKPTRRPATKSD
jgi:hypothetical protein